ncbi:MAG: sulfite exporter TauE/SafE family protein [Beijerinckiaceae bacterium]
MQDFLTQPAFWLAATIAVTLFGLSKGGFSGLAVLSVPILAMAVPTLIAAAILLPVLISQDMVGLWTFRKHLDRKSLLILFAGAVAGTVIGALLASRVPVEAITLLLGIIALVFGTNWWVQRLRGHPEKPPHRASDAAGLFWGTLTGITSFIAHAGAPPAQVYLMPLRLPPLVFAGTMTFIFAGLNLVKLLPYTALGLFTRETLIASAILFPIAVLSMLAGVELVKRLPVARFYPIIYGLLIVMGIRLIWTGIAGLR